MESFEGLGEIVVSRERESFRNSDDTDGESIEELDQSVHVIRVRVREHDTVDAAQASLPERRGDRPLSDSGIHHLAAVVEPDQAVLILDDRGEAMFHGQEIDTQVIRPISRREVGKQQ
jgi:hypothetical protein